MEVIASPLKKDSGKERTIVEGWRSQWLRAERGLHCFVDSSNNQVVVGGSYTQGW